MYDVLKNEMVSGIFNYFFLLMHVFFYNVASMIVLLTIILNFVCQGIHVVEDIILDLDTLTKNLSLSSDSLARMTHVRFLKIHRGYRRKCKFNVYFLNGLESLSYK